MYLMAHKALFQSTMTTVSDIAGTEASLSPTGACERFSNYQVHFIASTSNAVDTGEIMASLARGLLTIFWFISLYCFVCPYGRMRRRLLEVASCFIAPQCKEWKARCPPLLRKFCLSLCPHALTTSLLGR